MYCKKCGKELTGSEAFCSACGEKIIDNLDVAIKVEDKKDKNKLYAFYIAIATLPILFIIRMLSQETVHVPLGSNHNWQAYDETVVPENIQAIMIVILIASSVLNIALRKKSNSTDNSKKTISNILFVVNILIGILLTFGRF